MSIVESNRETQVIVWLFGKPDWELDIEGADVTEETADEIELKGKELQARLLRDAQIVRRLVKSGWVGSGGLYDLFFSKPVPLERAERELTDLGISGDEVTLEELELEFEASEDE
jgi:hypothetical protein